MRYVLHNQGCAEASSQIPSQLPPAQAELLDESRALLEPAGAQLVGLRDS